MTVAVEHAGLCPPGSANSARGFFQLCLSSHGTLEHMAPGSPRGVITVGKVHENVYLLGVQWVTRVSVAELDSHSRS